MNTNESNSKTYALSEDGSLQPLDSSHAILDLDDYHSIHSDGIGYTTKEMVRGALRTWACDGYTRSSDILKFLDQMREDVSNGTIRDSQDHMDFLF